MCFSTKPKGGGGGVTPTAVAAPPPSPSAESKQARFSVGQAQGREQQRRVAARGRRSTILTGPQGLQEEATIQRKTLLGQ